jgi:hypothetical protein
VDDRLFVSIGWAFARLDDPVGLDVGSILIKFTGVRLLELPFGLGWPACLHVLLVHLALEGVVELRQEFLLSLHL